jgi:hypothetical protein
MAVDHVDIVAMEATSFSTFQVSCKKRKRHGFMPPGRNEKKESVVIF